MSSLLIDTDEELNHTRCLVVGLNLHISVKHKTVDVNVLILVLIVFFQVKL